MRTLEGLYNNLGAFPSCVSVSTRSGRAVVAGTRVRVATILACYRQGMTVEEILQEYAHLRPADVHDALAYAYEHTDKIEADLAADDESSVQHKYSTGDSG